MGEEGGQEQFWEMTTYWTQLEETEAEKEVLACITSGELDWSLGLPD